MRFFPPEIQSTMDRFLYVLACKNEGASKTNMIVDLVKNLALGGIFIKIFDIQGFVTYVLLGIIGILYILWEIFFGRYLIVKHVIIREGSMNNKLKNPELMKILENK